MLLKGNLSRPFLVKLKGANLKSWKKVTYLTVPNVEHSRIVSNDVMQVFLGIPALDLEVVRRVTAYRIKKSVIRW